jgi:hypothetical protein
MKQKSRHIAFVLAFALIAAPTAFAAGGHGDDHKPKFGGIVSEGKAFDAELVAKPDLVTVYLAPADDTKLEAKGKFNVASGTKAVVVITPEGKTASTLRFTIK